MSQNLNIRWGWLKAMYIYTAVVAGGLGVMIVINPAGTSAMMGGTVEDPITFGIVGSVYTAFGLLSLLGLRAPLKFVPVLLLQLCYKSIWFVGVILPLLISGQFPSSAIPIVVIFALYVIGDLVAIPFPYILGKKDIAPSSQ